MSQKSIFKKVIALIVTIYILLGNVSIIGVSFNKSIAEEFITPGVNIEHEIEKYVQYNNQSGKGVILKIKLQLAENIYKQQEYKAIDNIKLEINVPEINEQKPKRVSIVEVDTTLTNRKIDGEINQNYDSNSGLLTMYYENKDNYSEYKENAKDKFEVIYIYDEGAYTGNDNEITVDTAVKVNVKRKEESKVTEKTEKFEIKLKENIGHISQIETVEVSDIYKGYMYSNEENKTTYETSYTQKETLEILNNEIIDDLIIIQKESKFLTNANKEVNANIKYKATTVTEDSFKKILGQDGYIDVFIADQKYATIKYSAADEEENRKYIVEYANGEQKEVAGKIEYAEEVKEIKIKASKPIAEGEIELVQEKVIKAEQEEKISNIKGIKEVKITIGEKQLGDRISETIENKIIELKEPTTQMTLELSNNNLSTLATNNIIATIKLNDTNSSCKLFEAGKIELVLPDNLTSAKVSAKSLYQNGLKMTNVKIENGRVVMTIEGKQTAYDIENISGGVNIVMNLELDIEDTTPSHQETLNLIYGNEKISTNINIVSKSGLLMLNSINTENNKIATTIGNEQKTIDLLMNKENQKVEQKIDLVNNYDNEISSLSLIGVLGYSTENTVSNFNVKMTDKIRVNNKDVKIYYSDTIGEYNWTEEYTENAKAYKIETSIQSKEKLQIVLTLTIPESLSYNKENYLNANVNYTYNNVLLSQNSTIKMATYQKEDILETKLQTIAGNKEINSGDEVLEGQILKSKITLKNNSSYETSYKIVTNIENAVYYEKYETGYIYNVNKDSDTRYAEAELGDVYREKNIVVPANSTAEYEYQYVVNKDTKTVSNKIKVLDKNDNIIDELTVQNTVKTAKIKLSISYAFNEEAPVMETMNAVFSIKNYEDKDLKDIELKIDLSEQLKPNEFEYYGDSNIELHYDDETNIMNVNIDKVKANEVLNFVVVYNVALDKNSVSEIVSLNASCEYDGQQYLSNNFTKIAYQTETNLQLNVSHNAQKEQVKNGDTLQYTVNIINSGVLDLTNSILKFLPDDGIVVNSGNITYSDGTKQKIDLDNLENTILNIKANDNITIIYDITISEVSENMENVFTLIDNYWNVLTKTSKLSGVITEDNIDIENSSDDPNEENGENKDENNSSSMNNYSISGIAWIDNNKDGKRDDDETLVSGIKVMLINAITGETVKDDQNNEITVTTDNNGYYHFTDLEKGTYLVMFEFDTNKYTVTAYQKETVEEAVNSDTIINEVTIDGTKSLVGITDNIEITNQNIENIDIGLIENALFDLSLDKQISSITVTNTQGTKTTEYKNKNFAKVDLVAKYMNNTNVIVTYKFVIKNEGEVTGYVDSLVDDLPSGLEFSSELNKDWYKGSDGNLYTSSLTGIAIKPGETSEIELVLTKKTTENTTGTFSNNAKIDKMSNLEAIIEKDNATQNNTSSADMVISIKTGSAILYIGITSVCLVLIGLGAYIIKKKILSKGI